ncbi:MAG: 4Fe-4S binding protein [Planctomycetes bacterium]|nr:4Fe-4S binding protein [Planctomycetota bacterium]
MKTWLKCSVKGNYKVVLRNIIKIDEGKCDGCGQCVNACAEGAIKIIDGKAKLVSEIYCDGLGACLGTCPQDAITIEKRQASAFNEEATKEYLAKEHGDQKQAGFSCPGVMQQKLRDRNESAGMHDVDVPSRLSHWPIQLELVSPSAPYFANSDLLVVADCVSFAVGDFHDKFIKGHSIVIGCPKLDDSQFYIEKLAAILETNDLKSLTVVHMEVPCCGGLTQLVRDAIARSGKKMVFKDVTIGLRGDVSRSETVSI